ncbi:MAG TPA: mannonate dehydratase [Candidatus Acidoferrales bacterium]|nr:mannonate dehydratase [Candidatus Acidoferrales bacterium]
MPFEQTWRWFGPNDPISLEEVRQTGATGIVTSLHQIPTGETWSIEKILERKNLIEKAGLRWSVTESIPVHEDIKKRIGNYRKYIDNYKETIRNLGQCGIGVVCYNFMPVLDWLRTDLRVVFKDGSITTKFERRVLAAFDIFMLKRKDSEKDYRNQEIKEAEKYFRAMTSEQRDTLHRTILLGFPGSLDAYTLDGFRSELAKYEKIDAGELRENLYFFIKEIIASAEESDVLLGIHPDDPPFQFFGLPRVVSSKQDFEQILSVSDSQSNGITYCPGSLAASTGNNIVEMAEAFASRINFIHLRNVKRDGTGGFIEDNHLDGDVDMYRVMKPLVLEQERRAEKGLKSLPMRPDHGHLMIPDMNRKGIYPGYSLFGRMRGLSELRGLELGIRRSLGLQ